MVSAAEFFASAGVTLPAGFVVDNLTSVSHNGNVICGFGHDGSVFPSPNEAFVITLDDVVSVPDVAALRGLTLEPNYPNPFNPATKIALSVEIAQQVRLEVYNARGQLVRRLHDGALTTGRHEMTWDGRDDGGLQVASGVYFARARDEAGATEAQRMMLVK
jgi:hypothetical protein